MEKYDSFVVTEKTQYRVSVSGQKMYYLHQVNRKEWTFPIWMVVNSIKSLKLLIQNKPDAVITTGVLAMVPLCILAKLFRKKLIYIESFAKVTSPTETGKLLYKFADQFYIQWEELRSVYKNAIYKGGIY